MGRWRNSRVDFNSCPRPFALGQADAPQPHGIVLLGESPHREEFDGARTPIGPMRDRNTRRNLCGHLSSVIGRAQNILGINLSDVDVVIANPVQFQASLAHFMRDRDICLQTWLRNAVWKGLFADSAIRGDFRRRISAYNPALVIVATTYDLRKPLRDELRNLSLVDRAVVVSHHPCVWNSPLLRVERFPAFNT